MAQPMIRWHATVLYRSESGVVDVKHDLVELADLHDLVELGPHWDTIEEIHIKRVNERTGKRAPLRILRKFIPVILHE